MIAHPDPDASIDLLAHVVPFDAVPRTSRDALYPACEREKHAAGFTVDLDSLSILVVLEGCVRLLDNERVQTVRQLGRGSVFGHFALIRQMQAPYSAVVSQTAELLRIPRAALLKLFNRHPFISAWFHVDLRRFERELGAFDDVAGSRFLFGQRLRDLEQGLTPRVDAEDSIRDVARHMTRHQCNYVMITDASERPVGILSDRGLRERVVATGHSVDLPVADVMTRDLLTIRARASVFDGLLAMEERGWNHLILLDDEGKLQGVISDTDLARTLLASPSALRHRINQADSGEQLRELRRSADQVVITLYRRGVRADDLLKMNTRFNDAMTRRILALVQREMPPPPTGLRWCWLSLGSEGRGEMGLLTDQDNAIVYACSDTEAADRWLGPLASMCNRLLDAAGIQFCDGGVMAREPAMRHDVDGWMGAVEHWLKEADDTRLLWISALCDARPLHGDEALQQALRGELTEWVGKRRRLLRLFAREALLPDLPLKRFPSLRLRGTRGDEGPSLNLKRQGTHLVTHAARLLCLDAGHLEHAGTVDRLQWLVDSRPELEPIAREAIIAFNVLVDLRLSWQVHQASNEQPLTDVMPLEHFGQTRQRLLLGAYQTVEEVRLRIRHQFGMST